MVAVRPEAGGSGAGGSAAGPTDVELPEADLRAVRVLAASPHRVFEFLADLRNHWLLQDRFVELAGLDTDEGDGPNGGRVRMRGPLGISREARTRVLAATAGRVPGGV